MATLTTTFILAGIIAGLIQYFVDFLKLPIYSPPEVSVNEAMLESLPKPDFWTRLKFFLQKNWEFFGYLIVGIAGAFLVPVIDQILHLSGIKDYLDCVNQKAEGVCKNQNWNLLIIFGYGIVSGYSSVRIIRSFGSFITNKMGKDLDKQKSELEKTKKELLELRTKVNGQFAAEASTLPIQTELLEGEIEEVHVCDGHEPDGQTEAAEGPGCKEFPQPWTGKKWRVAKSLASLLNEINTIAPKRNKKWDGTIGDLAHQGRKSDHNPHVLDVEKNIGIVTALDITNDPANKCDCNTLASKLQKNKDERISYMIWNGRIMSSKVAPWTWRTYTGSNPHNKHMHISVKCENCDDDFSWDI